MKHYLKLNARRLKQLDWLAITQLKTVRLSLLGILVAALWAFPASAWAEEAEAAHEASSGLDLLLPDLGEFIPMLIGFIILWALLAKFAWPMILDMLETRVNTIRTNLEQAEAARVETAQLLDEQKALLSEAREDAARIIAEAKTAGELARTDIEAQAAETAENILERARLLIEHEKDVAMLELRSSVADISVALAGRLIGTELDVDQHRQIIEHYVAQAGSFDDN